MQILAGASFHPNTYLLFDSYSKLMRILRPPKYIPLVKFLFVIDATPLQRIVVSKRAVTPYSGLHSFIIEFAFEIELNPLWDHLPPLMPLIYSILIYPKLNKLLAVFPLLRRLVPPCW